MTSAEHILPHAITETMDAVIAPSVRHAVLEEALEEAGNPQALNDPEALQAFVAGPLRASLIRALGSDLGESLADELRRVLDLLPPSSLAAEEPRTGRRIRKHAPRRTPSPRPGTLRARFAPTPPPVTSWPSPESDPPTSREPVRHGSTQPSPSNREGRTTDIRETRPPASANDPRREDDRPTIPSIPLGRRASSGPPRVNPPSSAQHPRGTAAALGVLGTTQAPDRPLPLVLVATNDGSLARRLGAWLDPHAAVRRVRSAGALVREIHDATGARCVIVLDCKEPSIRPIVLAALADDLPRDTRVIVWGASDEVRSELCLVSERAACFLYTGADKQPRDVADQCAELVS